MPVLGPWAAWTQLNDLTADGRLDENRFNNCGPEAVAECLKYLTGIELPADFIKDVMYGEAYSGYTDVPHLVNFLQKRCEVPCEVHGGEPDLQPVIRAALDAGHPIIVLYYWKLELPASGHWCPVIGYDDKGCTRANVWNGKLETWDWATFKKWQKGGVAIVLKRTRPGELAPATRAVAGDPLVARMLVLMSEAQPHTERARQRLAARPAEKP
jgi:hypothetical protein